MRIVHFITSLHPDGAQRVLLRLLKESASQSFHSLVVSLSDVMPLEERFRATGAEVVTLGLNHAGNIPLSWKNARRIVRAFEPDLVQGWMYHGNLFASLAAGRRVPACWNIRTSVAEPSDTTLPTRVCRWMNGRLSGAASCIIYCSEESRRQHRKAGFSGTTEEVLCNGFDTRLLKPSSGARDMLKSELGLGGDEILVGNVGRFHPAKDHKTLLEAAAEVVAANPSVHFVLAGQGLTKDNIEIAALAGGKTRALNVHLLGSRSDIERVLPGLSIYCSSSSVEGFPNAIGEAMACGVPVVATDAGGSRELVGDCGAMVPPRDPHSLAQALLDFASKDGDVLKQMGANARRRIIENYSLGEMVKRYESLYSGLVSGNRTCRLKRKLPATPAFPSFSRGRFLRNHPAD